METNLEKLQQFFNDANVVEFSNKNVDKDFLELPKDLTELPLADISKYLNAIVQQKMYIRTLVSRSRAVYRESKAVFDKERYRVFSQAPAKMSVTEKELRVFEDESAEKAKKFMEFALERFDYLKDIMESYDDAQFLISRELTRRMKDFEDMGRAGKFNV